MDRDGGRGLLHRTRQVLGSSLALLRGTVTRRRVTLAGTLLVVVALAAAVRELDGGSVVSAIAGADLRLVAAAAVVYAASWPLRGRRYGDVLAPLGHRPSTTFLTAAVFLSQAANLALPARAGDGARAYVLKNRRGIAYPTGAASMAVERAFDLAAVGLLAAVALGGLVVAGEVDPTVVEGKLAATVGGWFDGGSAGAAVAGGVEPALLAGLTVGAAGVFVGGLAVFARRDRWPGSALRQRVARTRLHRIVDPLLAFLGDLRAIARSPRAIAAVGAGSLLVWALDALTAVLVFAALDGVAASPSLLALGTVAVCVGNLAKVLPLSQGGIGLYEAAFAAVVVGLSPIGAGTALAAAVVDHALKNAVTLFGGVGATLALNVSPSTLSRGDPPKPTEF